MCPQITNKLRCWARKYGCLLRFRCNAVCLGRDGVRLSGKVQGVMDEDGAVAKMVRRRSTNYKRVSASFRGSPHLQPERRSSNYKRVSALSRGSPHLYSEDDHRTISGFPHCFRGFPHSVAGCRVYNKLCRVGIKRGSRKSGSSSESSEWSGFIPREEKRLVPPKNNCHGKELLPQQTISFRIADHKHDRITKSK